MLVTRECGGAVCADRAHRWWLRCDYRAFKLPVPVPLFQYDFPFECPKTVSTSAFTEIFRVLRSTSPAPCILVRSFYALERSNGIKLQRIKKVDASESIVGVEYVKEIPGMAR